jgi:hypothetical protein
MRVNRSGVYAQLVRRQLQEAPSSIATLASVANTASSSSALPSSSDNGNVRVVVHHD